MAASGRIKYFVHSNGRFFTILPNIKYFRATQKSKTQNSTFFWKLWNLASRLYGNKLKFYKIKFLVTQKYTEPLPNQSWINIVPAPPTDSILIFKTSIKELKILLLHQRSRIRAKNMKNEIWPWKCWRHFLWCHSLCHHKKVIQDLSRFLNVI